MPISATGHSESAVDRLRMAGFTLIEILVVLVILATLAVTVNLTLPDPARQAAADAVQAWHRQAELAARLAEARAAPIAWEIRGGQSRLLESRDQIWLPLSATDNGQAGQTLSLPPGLGVRQLEIDGQGSQCNPCASQQVVFLPGEPPLFRLQIAGPGRAWRIDGLPNGRIELAGQP